MAFPNWQVENANEINNTANYRCDQRHRDHNNNCDIYNDSIIHNHYYLPLNPNKNTINNEKCNENDDMDPLQTSLYKNTDINNNKSTEIVVDSKPNANQKHQFERETNTCINDNNNNNKLSSHNKRKHIDLNHIIEPP
eukprot:268687_1